MTGSTPMFTSLALTMLSMNVVIAKPARPSGAELPQPLAGTAGTAAGWATGGAMSVMAMWALLISELS